MSILSVIAIIVAGFFFSVGVVVVTLAFMDAHKNELYKNQKETLNKNNYYDTQTTR